MNSEERVSANVEVDRKSLRLYMDNIPRKRPEIWVDREESQFI